MIFPESSLLSLVVCDLYAGAAQCLPSQGKLAGSLTVSSNGDGTFDYTYMLTGTGLYFTEVHLYVGNTPVPMVTKGKNTEQATVSPGQYTYNGGSVHTTTYSFTVAPDDYFIAHGVVCGSSCW
jgi:hypothetical protein